MPQLANITVKKADNTTDVVYVSKSPASGSEPAIWRNESVGTAASHRPELRLAFKESGDGKNRVGRITYTYPEFFVNATTGQTTVSQRPLFAADIKFDKNVTQATVDEFVAQSVNLLSSPLIKQCLMDGYSAT